MDSWTRSLRSEWSVGRGGVAHGWRAPLRLRASIVTAVVALAWLPCLAESADVSGTTIRAVRVGALQPTGPGTSEFRELASAPSDAAFGVQVIPEDDKPYRLLIVITAPETLGSVDGGLIVDDSGDGTVVATQALVFQGTVTRTFTLSPEDPRGRYQLDVYVDGVKVGGGTITLLDSVSL